jgi:GT2 family glycosyltransferase
LIRDANNKGINISRGRYILLLNSDTVVIEDCIKKCINYLDKQKNIGALGCKIILPGGNLDKACKRGFPTPEASLYYMLKLDELYPQSRKFGKYNLTYIDENVISEVDSLVGAFMMLRRETIYEVGLLDERFFMYGEETDWCYRFKKAGWKILFTPAAQIIHLGGASSKQVKGAMLVQLRMSILKFIKKHHGPLVYHEAAFLSLLFFILRIPYWYGKALINSSQRTEAVYRARAYWNGIRSILCS